MALDTLTAKANTGSGTDQLAGMVTANGFAGAVVGTDGIEPERLSTEATLEAARVLLAAIAAAVKAEDTTAVSGDKGIPMLAMRQLADTTSTDADGDYTLLKVDERGRVKTASQPAKYDLVTGNITAISQTVFCECSRGSNVIAHVVPAPTMAGHNCTFEASLDSTNGTDGAWFAIDAKRTNANTVELVTGALAAAPVYAWELSVNGYNFIRVRATAHTSGTATWKFQQAPYATEPAPAIQITGTQPVSGTVTNNPSKLGTTSRVPLWATGQHVVIGATSAKTSAITGTEALITVSTDCFINIGTQSSVTATAGAGSMFLAKGGPYLFQITSGQGIAVIQATAGGTMSVLPVT